MTYLPFPPVQIKRMPTLGGEMFPTLALYVGIPVTCAAAMGVISEIEPQPGMLHDIAYFIGVVIVASFTTWWNGRRIKKKATLEARSVAAHVTREINQTATQAKSKATDIGLAMDREHGDVHKQLRELKSQNTNQQAMLVWLQQYCETVVIENDMLRAEKRAILMESKPPIEMQRADDPEN